MQPTGIKLCKVPRILIVEDDISQRQLMVKLIRAAFDCEILEVSDGLEALMIMSQDKQTPDLVLLDLILPCMNGVEFLKIVRGRAEFNHIPVVVCSSVVETKEISGVMSDWIHGYLVKPINKEKLLVKLLAALHDIVVRVDYQSLKFSQKTLPAPISHLRTKIGDTLIEGTDVVRMVNP